jgi:hypothetical protein
MLSGAIIPNLIWGVCLYTDWACSLVLS